MAAIVHIVLDGGNLLILLLRNLGPPVASLPKLYHRRADYRKRSPRPAEVDLEILEFAGVRLPLHLDVVNPCPARAIVAPPYQRVHVRFFALEYRLHPPVRKVAYPARHAVGVGFAARGFTEDHSLDPAGYVDVSADVDHPHHAPGRSRPW